MLCILLVMLIILIATSFIHSSSITSFSIPIILLLKMSKLIGFIYFKCFVAFIWTITTSPYLIFGRISTYLIYPRSPANVLICLWIVALSLGVALRKLRNWKFWMHPKLLDCSWTLNSAVNLKILFFEIP